MRQQSAKAAATARERRKRRGPATSCPRCHRARAVDVHELARRSQSSQAATDVFIQVELCRQCHDWVGNNPAAAVEQGWAMWGWQYRQQLEADTNVYERVMVSGVAEPRDILTARVSHAANAYVDKTAGDEHVSRAVVIRAMLSVATQHPEEILAKIRGLSAADRIDDGPPSRRGQPQPKIGTRR